MTLLDSSTQASGRARPPGVTFRQPEQSPVLSAVRLDTCVFAGVSRRGPCRHDVADGDNGVRPARTNPVLVESWDQFVHRFGTNSPGLLGPAVAAFFDNGGLRAYVIRIVHEYGGPENGRGRASAPLVGLLAERDPATGVVVPGVAAVDEGGWGNGLEITGQFRFRPLATNRLDTDRVGLAGGEGVPVGSLLLGRDHRGNVIRSSGQVVERWVEEVSTDRLSEAVDLVLDGDLPAGTEGVEVVTVDLAVRLAEEGLVEHHDNLGLGPGHPRYLGAVLDLDSVLVGLEGPTGKLHPDYRGGGRPLDGLVGAGLGGQVEPEIVATGFGGGEDRGGDIVPDDFFDAGWIPGDEPGDGVHAITDHDDIGLICVPDLYAPFRGVENADVGDRSLAGAGFAPCVEPVVVEPVIGVDELDGLRLDPNTDFEVIVAQQAKLVALADQLRGPVVLLDVPPGLTERRVRGWRARFASSYAAAYYPWVRIPAGDRLRSTTPSAAAAGIIAARERLDGVAAGPANVVVVGAVGVSDSVTAVVHGEFHHLGINVLVSGRDGVRVMGARTLSSNRQVGQLSVRRLMVLIRRTLEQRMQWVAFEPYDELLAADVRQIIRSFLRGLAGRGAFRGAAEGDSFFVRCDSSTNPPSGVDAGRLIAEVGVAPAHPMEFIEVTVAVAADATVRAEEVNG